MGNAIHMSRSKTYVREKMPPRKKKRKAHIRGATQQKKDYKTGTHFNEQIQSIRHQLSQQHKSLQQQLDSHFVQANKDRNQYRTKRLWLGIVTTVLGFALFTVFIGPLLPSPPPATLSTVKGGQVEGIKGGAITATTSPSVPLNVDFATELHLTGSTQEQYALELRAPRADFIKCNDDCPSGPLLIQLEFTEAADGSIYHVIINDGNTVDTSMVDLSFSSNTGARFDANDIGGEKLRFLSFSLKNENRSSVVQVLLRREVFLSRPADAGWTLPIVRIEVTPKQDNAAQSGPYFALQAPLVKTINANQSLFGTTPLLPDGKVVLGPIPELKTLQGLIDETGTAIITGSDTLDNTWSINPSRMPEGSGPVVSYVDHRQSQKQTYYFQALLLVSAALVSTGLGVATTTAPKPKQERT